MNDDERDNTDYGYDDRWLQECEAILSGEIPASDLTKEMVRAWLSHEIKSMESHPGATRNKFQCVGRQ